MEDKFDSLSPSECGYFENKISMSEAYLFPTKEVAFEIFGRRSQKAAFDFFLAQGFRRNGRIIYRETCPHCQKCVPIRIRIDDFCFSKSQRSLIRKNSDVTVTVTFNQQDFATPEKVALMKKYNLRHEPDKKETDSEVRFLLLSMNGLVDLDDTINEEPVFNGVMNMEYRLEGKLIGCGIVDIGNDSLSSNYFYYDTDSDIMKRSLGTFSILQEIKYCMENDFEFYYLGYYIADCKKMSYKARFKPHETRDLETACWTRCD